MHQVSPLNECKSYFKLCFWFSLSICNNAKKIKLNLIRISAASFFPFLFFALVTFKFNQGHQKEIKFFVNALTPSNKAKVTENSMNGQSSASTITKHSFVIYSRLVQEIATWIISAMINQPKTNIYIGLHLFTWVNEHLVNRKMITDAKSMFISGG